jgi:1,5-anhydro-D-fructose reductase (1,5-anhydro-D-mannitol-forming)
MQHTTSTTSTLFAKPPPSPPPIQWGIIGLGDVCTIKSGPAFYKSSGSTLIAVMRRTPGAAQRWVEKNREFVQQYNSNGGDNRGGANGDEVELRGYDNIEQMIHENIHQLDAIYVATPPSVHLDNVRQILSALDSVNTTEEQQHQQQLRLKAIYVEKPCGRSAWETRTMIDELQYRNIQFFPAYVSRAHERTQTLIQLLSVEQQQQQEQHDTKKSSSNSEETTTIIGDKVTSIRYTQRGSSFARGLDNNGGKGIPWRLNAEQSGGGLIMDMGCHILDRFDYLFGPITNVKSEVLRKGGGRGGSNSNDDDNYPLVEDYVSMSGIIGKCDWATIPSAEGASVDCLWDFSPNADDQDELLITGTNGRSIRMAGMGAGLPIEVLDVDGRTVLQRIEFEAPMHAAQPLIQSIVNELRGGVVNGGGADNNNQQCLVKSPATADNAIRTSEVLDAILNSYYGGRHDEFWTRPNSWPGLKK